MFSVITPVFTPQPRRCPVHTGTWSDTVNSIMLTLDRQWAMTRLFIRNTTCVSEAQLRRLFCMFWIESGFLPYPMTLCLCIILQLGCWAVALTSFISDTSVTVPRIYTLLRSSGGRCDAWSFFPLISRLRTSVGLPLVFLDLSFARPRDIEVLFLQYKSRKSRETCTFVTFYFFGILSQKTQTGHQCVDVVTLGLSSTFQCIIIVRYVACRGSNIPSTSFKVQYNHFW